MTDPIQPLIPLTFVFNTSQRVTRDISQTLTQFRNNLIYNSTTPLSFETYPEDIYTTPLIREHHDSYLYYIDTHSLVANSVEPQFSIPFTSLTTRSDTFRKKHLSYNNIYIPFANVFTTFLNHLQEKNNLLPKHVLTLLPYKTFSKKNLFLIFLILNNFALLKIIPTIGLPPIFFKCIIFNTNSFRILPLIRKQKNKFRYTLFSFEISFDIIYQLVWHSKFQDACINFSQQFTLNELYLFSILLIINNLSFIIFLIFLLLILNTLPLTPTVLIKVLTFLLLFVLTTNNTIYHLQLIQFPMFLFTLFPHLQML